LFARVVGLFGGTTFLVLTPKTSEITVDWVYWSDSTVAEGRLNIGGGGARLLVSSLFAVFSIGSFENLNSYFSVALNGLSSSGSYLKV